MVRTRSQANPRGAFGRARQGTCRQSPLLRVPCRGATTGRAHREQHEPAWWAGVAGGGVNTCTEQQKLSSPAWATHSLGFSTITKRIVMRDD